MATSAIRPPDAVPLRAAGDGTVPVARVGTTAMNGPATSRSSKLPRVFDPPSGVLATANGRITAGRLPLFSGDPVGPALPHRAGSCRCSVAGENSARATCSNLQTDIYSDFDHRMAARFAEAVETTPGAGPRLREAARLLRAWDGQMSQRDSAAATIEVTARTELTRMLLEPKLGPD